MKSLSVPGLPKLQRWGSRPAGKPPVPATLSGVVFAPSVTLSEVRSSPRTKIFTFPIDVPWGREFTACSCLAPCSGKRTDLLDWQHPLFRTTCPQEHVFFLHATRYRACFPLFVQLCRRTGQLGCKAKPISLTKQPGVWSPSLWLLF